MTGIVRKFKRIWGDNPRMLLKLYTYQPELTKKLDCLQPEELTNEVINEIVLWKINRYPLVEPQLLNELQLVSKLKPGQHRNASRELRALLNCKGIGLGMASTILRFLNPAVFQIIDDRAYRIVEPGKAIPVKPSKTKVNDEFLKQCEQVYFSYLSRLHKISSKRLPFNESDRILYVLDKLLENKIGDGVKGSSRDVDLRRRQSARSVRRRR